MVVMGWQLNLMILEVFSNPSDSMILWKREWTEYAKWENAKLWSKTKEEVRKQPFSTRKGSHSKTTAFWKSPSVPQSRHTGFTISVVLTLKAKRWTERKDQLHCSLPQGGELISPTLLWPSEEYGRRRYCQFHAFSLRPKVSFPLL